MSRLFVGAVATLAVAACSAETTTDGGQPPPGPTDAGTIADSGGQSDAAGPADTGSPADSGVMKDAGTTTATLTWVAIPAGHFEMGCSENDDQCGDAERPVHTATIAAFSMTDTEITQAQYEAVIGSNPSVFFGCAECPVDSVLWAEAKAFCEAVGARLPTEAEWEYAARGGTTTRYPCGDDPACLDGLAWYFDNSNNATHPAGMKAANPFGLYDMLGNVWEWLEDCWHDDYTGDPPGDGSAWVEANCELRVVRGGSWGMQARGLRVSNRDGDYPDTYFLPPPGFRCARD